MLGQSNLGNSFVTTAPVKPEKTNSSEESNLSFVYKIGPQYAGSIKAVIHESPEDRDAFYKEMCSSIYSKSPSIITGYQQTNVGEQEPNKNGNQGKVLKLLSKAVENAAAKEPELVAPAQIKPEGPKKLPVHKGIQFSDIDDGSRHPLVSPAQTPPKQPTKAVDNASVTFQAAYNANTASPRVNGKTLQQPKTNPAESNFNFIPHDIVGREQIKEIISNTKSPSEYILGSVTTDHNQSTKNLNIVSKVESNVPKATQSQTPLNSIPPQYAMFDSMIDDSLSSQRLGLIDTIIGSPDFARKSDSSIRQMPMPIDKTVSVPPPRDRTSICNKDLPPDFLAQLGIANFDSSPANKSNTPTFAKIHSFGQLESNGLRGIRSDALKSGALITGNSGLMQTPGSGVTASFSGNPNIFKNLVDVGATVMPLHKFFTTNSQVDCSPTFLTKPDTPKERRYSDPANLQLPQNMESFAPNKDAELKFMQELVNQMKCQENATKSELNMIKERLHLVEADNQSLKQASSAAKMDSEVKPTHARGNSIPATHNLIIEKIFKRDNRNSKDKLKSSISSDKIHSNQHSNSSSTSKEGAKLLKPQGTGIASKYSLHSTPAFKNSDTNPKSKNNLTHLYSILGKKKYSMKGESSALPMQSFLSKKKKERSNSKNLNETFENKGMIKKPAPSEHSTSSYWLTRFCTESGSKGRLQESIESLDPSRSGSTSVQGRLRQKSRNFLTNL